MQRRRKLDIVYAEIACKLDPFFDGTVRIRISHFARSEFLQRGGQNADFHELWLKLRDRHLFLLDLERVPNPKSHPRRECAKNPKYPPPTVGGLFKSSLRERASRMTLLSLISSHGEEIQKRGARGPVLCRLYLNNLHFPWVVFGTAT